MRAEIKIRDNKDDVSLFINKDINVVIICKDYEEYLKGTVIYTEYEQFPLGYYSDKWNKELFTYFDGEVKLSNK